MPGESTSVTLRLPARPTTPAAVRHTLMSACHDLPSDVLSDASLLASELVTNAVRHAGSVITVVIECDSGSVAVAVGDHSAEPPAVQPDRPEEPGGYGLRLVDRLSSAWGWRPAADGEGKTTWFRIGEAAAQP